MSLPRGFSTVLAWFVAGVTLQAAGDGGDAANAHARGQSLYITHCSICHGATGDGVKGTYPPLARSDWLAGNRSGAVKAVVSGLRDEIVVNGTTYRGQMPAIVLDDASVADVLTFVLQSWGNPGGRVTPADVTAIRALTPFKTFAALKAAADYAELPAAPEGFSLRELVRLTDFGVRLASDGKGGPLYVLGRNGGVWRFDPQSGNLRQIIWPRDFAGVKPGDFQTLGFVRDASGALWITVNQRVEAQPVVLNECGIYRTSGFDAEGNPIQPRPWLRTSYPWGIGPYNHGLSDIRFGPDGMLYVSSGSRTDAGETGELPHLGRMGEVDLTAGLWRLDPRATEPKIEMIARGIRNAYSFAWDGDGRLFTVSNGPDAHAPEEMDHIVPPERGGAPRHHGFPYQFGDTPAGTRWYAHTPVPPPAAGASYQLPVLNLGPAGLADGKPTSTFNAHSSPTGLVWLGAAWPETVRNGFLMGRLGSFLAGPAPEEEHGFDLLQFRLARRADGRWTAQTRTFLAPLGRPIDVHVAAPGLIYVLEFTRPTSLKSRAGWLPGRILELRALRP